MAFTIGLQSADIVLRANAENTDTLTRRLIDAPVQSIIMRRTALTPSHSAGRHPAAEIAVTRTRPMADPAIKVRPIQVRFDPNKIRSDFHDEKPQTLMSTFSRVARWMIWST
jgi:hypothetical protein